MQDKAFDQLFKDALGHAEVQPSADLWNKLAKDLKKPVVKRKLPIYWIAAAAVALVFMSVLLLAPGQEKIKLQGASFAASGGTAPGLNQHTASAQDVNTEVEDKSTPLVIAPRVNEAAMEKDFIAMQPKQASARHDVKRLQLSPEIQNTVISDVRAQQDVMIAQVDVTELPDQNVPVENEEPAHKGIRNFGDLVNYVVDKVDKREQKFLKFNTDDDNSSLIAINIGFIKLNAKRHK